MRLVDRQQPRPNAIDLTIVLAAVVSDGFDRATFHRFLAKPFFFRRLRLLVNVGVTAVVIALEIRRRCLAAEIAVDALLIDVELAGCVFGIFVGGIGHNSVRLKESEVRWKRTRCNLKAENFSRVAGEFESRQGCLKIDIFREGKDLEAAPKHFGMEQGLQGAL